MKLSSATLVAVFLAQHASANPAAARQHLETRGGSALQCSVSRCAAKVKRAQEPPTPVGLAARAGPTETPRGPRGRRSQDPYD
ncbi:hypothetical protein GGTG_02100 [Gaeumannomyces tritici R3-111a-1]|uniref:Uncharacterized protein n=1 Tax=Gaeumannomyces tritici (strain R3-111a-1) TaxID=644352 RepID=J3NLF1_GAET3|nr:hypothetical protein GGTG_02100 [Gaeumannomyces tritici R3-111a-1]EJT82126.1 hypothetical protein GGTG_02100 [Gaeumannomyces tritici R3-111a-1]